MRRVALITYTDCGQLVNLLNDSGCYHKFSYKDIVGSELYGVYDDETLIACVLVLAQGTHAFIDYLCVHPLHQKEGVATRLLEHVKLVLRFKGVRTVHAAIASVNAPASHLAEKFGCTIGWPYINVLVSLEKE